MLARRPNDTVTELLTLAQSDSHEDQIKGLRTLASLTKVSPQNRNLVAETNGNIQTLFALSRSSSSTIEVLSLSILFNLSLNSNLKHTLADMELIGLLNNIILAPISLDSGILAASLICSLAMLDKNKAKFGVAGTVQALVEALKRPRRATSHHLLSSLSELVQFHGNCSLAVRAGAVPVLFGVVERTEGEDLAVTSLAILGVLAKFKEGIDAIMNTKGVVSFMVDVLKRRCMLSKEGCAEILIRLFEESEKCLRDAVGVPEFSSLVADLSVRGSAKAREKSGIIMKKMMDANLDPFLDGNAMIYDW
ncbi:hypothetical protein Sjap_019175 [Stephania japonica]|uniref:U-box domain-containing protein n=1 Tax=Stephania japonica TaxID=461633 RepID=A0AAP0EZJ5_9MAGN